MKSTSGTHRKGFTIVELLIVIVIIAILAAITAVSYNGIQARARDATRLQDAKSIEKGLRQYLAYNGNFFSHTTTSWETSPAVAPGSFMSALVTTNIMSKVPVDPVNLGAKYYRYYRYPAGYGGCDAAKGAFIVFQIMDMESVSGAHPASPGFACTGTGARNWSAEADYTLGIFENE